MGEDDDVQIIEESIEEKAESKKGLGNKLYKSNDFLEAIKRYTEAIALHPSAAVFANRSQCHLKLGDFRSALEDAERAIAVDPTYVKGYLKMVRCQISLGEIEKARETIEEASKHDQKNNQSNCKTSNNKSKASQNKSASISLSNEINNEQKLLQELDRNCALVQSNWSKGDWRAVIYYCNKILDVSPGFTAYKVKKAEAQVLHKQYGLGQKTIIDVLRGDQMNVEAIYVRGLALYFMGDTDKAYDHFRQALTLSPDHSKSLSCIKKIKEIKSVKEQAASQLASGRPRDALATYGKALNIDPTNDSVNSKLHFNQAICHSKLSDVKSAMKSTNRALELDPGYLKAKMKRVNLYIELEEYDEAVREAEQCYKTETNEATKSLLDSAKQALKRSKQKDFYKTLGVTKGASEDEIKKAYKRLALTHHPDRHASASEEDRKLHEKKFKEIGEAYEILSDPKKKARYDTGQDVTGTGEGFSGDPNDLFNAFFASGGGSPFFASYRPDGFGSSSGFRTDGFGNFTKS